MRFPDYYLNNAVASMMSSNGRKMNGRRLPALHIVLNDGSQRVMSYETAEEAREACYEFVKQSMTRQGKIPNAEL